MSNGFHFKRKIPDKWLYLGIVVLFVFFVIKLVDKSNIIGQFPLDINNDLSSYMALFYLFLKYGIHNVVSSWYNGFILFHSYPPAWFYFVYPIYYLFKKIELTIFISFLLIYSLSFILIYLLGKSQNISITKRIFFFLAFFANPISLSYFLRLGRITELFSWLFFIALFILLINYKDKSLDKKFLVLFVLIYSLLILSHPTTMIIGSTLILSLMSYLLIVKKDIKKIIFICLAVFISLIIVSPWLVPFLSNLKNIVGVGYETTRASTEPLKWIISSNPACLMDKLTTGLTSFIFLLLLYLNRKSKELLKFFLPQLILAILIFTRILAFIPIFNNVYPDSYNMMFMFLSLFLFLKMKFNFKNKLIRNLLILALIILPLLGITTSLIYTPNFVPHTPQDKEIISLFKEVEGRVIILVRNQRLLYAYGTIYNDINTPSGGSTPMASPALTEKLDNLFVYVKKKDCKSLENSLKELNVKSIIGGDNNCNILQECNFELKDKKEYACLFYYK